MNFHCRGSGSGIITPDGKVAMWDGTFVSILDMGIFDIE
jgi:hypothetical protein